MTKLRYIHGVTLMSICSCIAPLRGTVSDMWRMVWEYRIEVVLMLTTLTEDGTEVRKVVSS